MCSAVLKNFYLEPEILATNMSPGVLRCGSPILLRKSKNYKMPHDLDVAANDIQLMQAHLSDSCLGLAAPQIGINKRLIYVNIPAKNDRYITNGCDMGPLFMINPEYEVVGDETITNYEACLSLPHLMGLVTRAKTIKFSYYDNNGQRHENVASDLQSRVIQHEIDHLEGMLYLHRLDSLADLGYKEELEICGALDRYRLQG